MLLILYSLALCILYDPDWRQRCQTWRKIITRHTQPQLLKLLTILILKGKIYVFWRGYGKQPFLDLAACGLANLRTPKSEIQIYPPVHDLVSGTLLSPYLLLERLVNNECVYGLIIEWPCRKITYWPLYTHKYMKFTLNHIMVYIVLTAHWMCIRLLVLDLESFSIIWEQQC